METLDHYNELVKYDQEHIWHPYTSMSNPIPVYPVQSAHGVRINLVDGRSLIDGVSSWWTAIHGYSHPALNRAMVEQLSNMSHVMFGGLTHAPAVKLTKKLLQLVPSGLDKVFYCDSGSVAVEVAMKMALQYWFALGQKEKKHFATIHCGYHGDTWHAMSVCDPATGMHHLFQDILPKQFFVPRPSSRFGGIWNPNDIDALQQLFEEKGHQIAAFILEPILQGAGGLWFYHPHYLREAKRLCDKHGILLIFDEIATGFGRTGKMFACEHAEVVPDIMCLGKAINGGYVSLAATLTTAQVAKTVSSGSPGVLMHGPTYMGNPLACVVACASIDLLINSKWHEKIAALELNMRQWLEPANSIEGVKEVRVLGAVGVIEMHNNVDVRKMQEQFVANGVWIRPFENLVYIMPPYIIDDSDLKTLCDAMLSVIETQTQTSPYNGALTFA